MRFLLVAAMALGAGAGPLEKARDAQDRAGLAAAIQTLAADAARQAGDAAAQYRVAQAQAYAAEVANEVHDKNGARDAAVAGIRAAEKAVALKGGVAEYHRMLGSLCGQAISGGNLLAGMKYGKCALDEVNRAIELDPKDAMNYVSRGVGNYYMPAQFGGGADKAIADFEKAIGIDAKLAEAHLWLGVALRKAHRDGEARKAFEKSLELNPNRVWARQQLEKTPAK